MSMYVGLPVVHRATSANLNNFVYSQIYCGTSASTATVNGVAMTFAASSNVNLTIQSISNITGDLFLLGVPINVITGSTYVGGSYG